MILLVYFGYLMALLTLLANVTQADVCSIADNDVAEDACAMQRAIGGSLVVPQIIPEFSPTGALYAKYGNVVIGGAQQLSPARVYKSPDLSLALIDENPSALDYATLCLDFQLSTRVTRLIWLQDMLSRDRNSHLLTSTRPAILPYESPNPSPGSGTHEYLILLYQQTGAIRLSDFNVSAFNLQDFLSKSSLQGHMVAGSFFKSAYDGKSFPIQRTSQEEPGTLSANLSSVRNVSPGLGISNLTANSTLRSPQSSAQPENITSSPDLQISAQSSIKHGKNIIFMATILTWGAVHLHQ